MSRKYMLVIGISLCRAVVGFGAENLITNGQFNDGATGWQTQVTGGTADLRVVIDSDTLLQPALRIVVRDGGASVYQQIGPLQEAGYYQLTAKVHVVNTQARVRIGVGYGNETGPTICVSNHLIGATAGPQVLRAMCYTGRPKFSRNFPVNVYLELAGPGSVVIDDVAFAFLDQPLSTTTINDKVTAHDYGGGWEILDIEGRDKSTTFPVIRASQIQREEPAPTADERKHGFLTFVPADREGVLPDYRPPSAQRSNGAACFASPGEHELITFVVRPLRDLGTIMFSIADFASPTGASLGSRHTDLYVGDVTVEQMGLYRSDESSFIRRVKWLRPAVKAQANESENIQLFVDVHVPTDAAPGKYTAPVTITSKRGASSEFELTVEVLDLKLNRARHWGAYIYGWHGMPYRRQNALLKLRELRRHGMTQCVISPLSIQNRPGYEAGKPAAPDFGFYDECIALYQEAGFPDPPVLAMEGWLFGMTESLDQNLLKEYDFAGRRLIGVLPDKLPDDYKALAHRGLRRLYDHGLEQNLPPFYAYLADEPWSRGKTRLGALLMYPTARRAAGSLMTATSLYEAMGPFESTVDLNFIHYVHPCASAESAAAARQEAEKLHMKVLGMAWSMAVEDTFFDHCRVVGFMIEKCGLKGMMPWVQWVIGLTDNLSKPVDPYRDVLNYFKGGPWARNDKAGRISRALNLLGYREAIDDSRYVNTARALARRARASFDADIRQKGNDALQQVNTLLEQVPYKKEFDEKAKPWNDTAATNLRRRIATIAVDLQAMVGVDEFWQEDNMPPPRGRRVQPQ